VRADRVLDEYDGWLERQALAARTRSSYRRWVRELVAHLTAGGELDAFLAADGEDDRRAVLGDWRRRWLTVGRRPRPSISRSQRVVPCWTPARGRLRDCPRVEIAPPSARALSAAEFRAVELAADRLGSSRDRVLMQVLLRTGNRPADRRGGRA